MALDTLCFWYSKLQSPYMQLLSWIPKNTFVFIFHPCIVTISNPKCSAYPLGRRCYKLLQNKAGCKFGSSCMRSVWKRLLSLYQDCYYLGILLLLNKGVLSHSSLSVKQQQSPARCPKSFCMRSQHHPKSTDKRGEGKYLTVPSLPMLLYPPKSKQHLLHGNAGDVYYWAGSRSLFLARLICNCFKPN